MMPENNDKNLPVGSETALSGGSSQADTYQSQLEEARFVSSFTAAVCASLEVDGICSVAARALYDYAAYYRIVFAFSAESGIGTIVFSPALLRGILEVRPKVTVDAPCPHPPLSQGPLTCEHLELQDGLGAVSIYYKAGQGAPFSDALRTDIAACFSQAIRNALEHRAMKDLAMRDSLTGLFNRRIFDDTLAQQAKCQDKRPVSLLLIDLDDFKQVNDTFGHPSGDEVLKTFAAILKDSCRGHDLIARFGGEEFAVILSRTRAATAHAVARRIRKRLAEAPFAFDGRSVRITASIGLATCQDGSGPGTSSLVEKADQALYRAKMSGKDRICVSLHDLLMDSGVPMDGKNFGSLASASC